MARIQDPRAFVMNSVSARMRSDVVMQIPSTAAIADPATRRVMDAVLSAWRTRNGEASDATDARFITAGEIQEQVEGAMVNALSSALGAPGAGGPTNAPPTVRQISNLLDNLAAEMRKSLIYQLLETPFSPIQLQQLRERIEVAMGDARTLIMREIRVLEEADQVQIEEINALAVRMGNAEAAITSESTVRSSKDDALAKAINTMWASIGSSSAVIEDGALASVGPGSAVATRWNQVVAAVTDPNTGEVNSASIKEELNTYASNVDGSLNAVYSVRAQVSVGGQTVVGGFGLAATAGAGSAQGPTIDFGVRADRFFIAATADTPNAATQIAQGSQIPFMVLTSSQVVNGVVYAPGVYIKKAVIGDATIGTAQIANATITAAKIGDAQITNAKIASVIQSDNYVAGAQGWHISKSGFAEFDLVRIRRREVIATGVVDPAWYGAAGRANHIFITYGDGGKGSPLPIVNIAPHVALELPAFSTGVSDAAIRSTAANQPYGVAIWQESYGPLGGWSDGTPGVGDSFSLSFEGVACAATTYSNTGAWADSNVVHIVVRISSRVISGGGDYNVPPLRWVLFRL